MAGRLADIESDALVSVIMPCFNAEGTVARAISSIQGQTHQNWELIVIDDGSSDNSASCVEKLAKNDDRIRIIKQDHLGVVAASNHGLSYANGDLIARMDSDDVSRPLRLEQQAQALRHDPNLGAVSCLAHFAGNPELAGGYAHHVRWANQCLTPEEIELNRFIDLPVPHPTLMYRRSVIDSCGAYLDGEFPEDYEMVLRWISHEIKIGKIDEILFDWYDPPTRLSRNDTRYDMEAFHRCKAPFLTHAIAASGCADRELWIWGAGRPARKCARPLEQAWKQASGFVDIDPRKLGRIIHGGLVVGPDNLPEIEQAVIVSYVATRGARDNIRADLLATGRVEGVDFWLSA